MLFASDEQLQDLLFQAGILYVTAVSGVSACVSQFKAVFENIAYVILAPLPPRWVALQKPVCTCRCQLP